MNVIEVALNSGMKHLLIEIRHGKNLSLVMKESWKKVVLWQWCKKNFVFHRLEPPLDKNHRTCQHVMMVSMKQRERNSFWSCLTAHKNRYCTGLCLWTLVHIKMIELCVTTDSTLKTREGKLKKILLTVCPKNSHACSLENLVLDQLIP